MNASVPVSVSGEYTPLVGSCGGLFIVWYAPGPGQDYLWELTGTDGEHTTTPISVNGEYEPFIGDFDGDTCDDIFWYAPGSGQDYVWWNNSDFGDVDTRPVTVNGTYEPLVFELDDGGWDDIFWYQPGPGPEFIWEGQIDQSFEPSPAAPVNGDYRAAAVRDEILFHGPGTAPDYLWSGVEAGAPAPTESTPITLNGDYQPFAANRELGSVVLYGPGSGYDQIATSLSDPPIDYYPGTVNGTYTVGRSSPTVSHLAIVWHAPGPATDYLWLD
ncbi:MAG: hypothetical protein U5K30_05615 [Acidimicrobiales bacterium]|nr:hypothetical protein [Acidimicrobiales bacterium]